MMYGDMLTDNSPFYGVTLDCEGNVDFYDPCDTRQEAEEFCAAEGGVVMSRRQLKAKLASEYDFFEAREERENDQAQAVFHNLGVYRCRPARRFF